MSNDIRNWAKTVTVGDRNAKVILLELADCADESGLLNHRIETIAATLEMSTKTVERGLAYLEDEKKLISRTTVEKEQGRFSHKQTQIIIPESAWLEIERKRELRATKKAPQPTDNLSDNLTDGGTHRQTICPQPTDNLSDNLTDGGTHRQTICPQPTDNLSDNLTDGGTHRQTICPQPTDNLSNGQIVALNSNKESLNTNKTKTTETRERERPREQTMSPAAYKILVQLRQKFNLEELPDESDWIRSIEWSVKNNLDKGFLECYDLLNGQIWRDSVVSGKTVIKNLPKLKELREKIAAENAALVKNGNHNHSPPRPKAPTLDEFLEKREREERERDAKRVRRLPNGEIYKPDLEKVEQLNGSH